MRKRGTVIGDLIAVRDTDDEPSLDSRDWTICLITDASLLPSDGVDGKDSTVPGPAGKDSTVPGPAGLDSRVPGPAGKDGKGFNFLNEWSPRLRYEPLDVVTSDGQTFICTEQNRRKPPEDNPREWALAAARGQKGDPGERGGAGQRGRSLPHFLAEQGSGGGSVTMQAIFDSDTSAGEVLYISGDGHVDLAQANNYLTATAVGIATEDVAAGQTGDYIPVGPVTCETWNLTPATVYYLDPDVAGGITSTYPDESGQFVVILGAAATPNQLNLSIHYFLEQA